MRVPGPAMVSGGRDTTVKRRRHTAEQIVRKLREVERLLGEASSRSRRRHAAVLAAPAVVGLLGDLDLLLSLDGRAARSGASLIAGAPTARCGPDCIGSRAPTAVGATGERGRRCASWSGT